MAGLTRNFDEIWERLNKNAPDAYEMLKNDGSYTGVTGFVKLNKFGNNVAFLSQGCHYGARYKSSYAGLFTTAYTGSGFKCVSFGSFDYSSYLTSKKMTTNTFYAWYAKFLESVINDEKSFYHNLKDYVKLFYVDDKPVMWMINGLCQHNTMTSFLVSTRKVKEHLYPTIVYRLLELYPDLRPMEAFVLAEIVFSKIPSVKEFFKNTDVDLAFPNSMPLRHLYVGSSHTHCAHFHPYLFNPSMTKDDKDITWDGHVESTTYDKLGFSKWESHKSSVEFSNWIKNYGVSETVVKPLFHKINHANKSTKIPLSVFIPRFKQFIEEINA